MSIAIGLRVKGVNGGGYLDDHVELPDVGLLLLDEVLHQLVKSDGNVYIGVLRLAAALPILVLLEHVHQHLQEWEKEGKC